MLGSLRYSEAWAPSRFFCEKTQVLKRPWCWKRRTSLNSLSNNNNNNKQLQTTTSSNNNNECQGEESFKSNLQKACVWRSSRNHSPFIWRKIGWIKWTNYLRTKPDLTFLWRHGGSLDNVPLLNWSLLTLCNGLSLFRIVPRDTYSLKIDNKTTCLL